MCIALFLLRGSSTERRECDAQYWHLDVATALMGEAIALL